MQVVLQAQREGAESWEMHCFMHGLPTAHTGSWLPSTGRPACENLTCVDLNDRLSPELVRGASHARWKQEWELRRNMECEVCARERQRRRWVDLSPSYTRDAPRYVEEAYVDAPYVHPFNAPKYHAQQLCTLAYAKLRQRRLLWIVATDVFQDKSTRSRER